MEEKKKRQFGGMQIDEVLFQVAGGWSKRDEA